MPASGEVAMLIPSIDLMGGKIVQLVQGEKKALEFDNFDYWIERFSKYPLVQVIDLDAARGAGNNRLTRESDCATAQLPGGRRDSQPRNGAAKFYRRARAEVILGSALLEDGKINTQFAATLASELGTAALVFALDSRGGRVAIDGWRQETAVTAFDMIRALEPFCETFLYTHIDTEGLMGGIPMETVRAIRQATSRRLVVAGGITNASKKSTCSTRWGWTPWSGWLCIQAEFPREASSSPRTSVDRDDQASRDNERSADQNRERGRLAELYSGHDLCQQEEKDNVDAKQFAELPAGGVDHQSIGGERQCPAGKSEGTAHSGSAIERRLKARVAVDFQERGDGQKEERPSCGARRGD